LVFIRISKEGNTEDGISLSQDTCPLSSGRAREEANGPCEALALGGLSAAEHPTPPPLPLPKVVSYRLKSKFSTLQTPTNRG